MGAYRGGRMCRRGGVGAYVVPSLEGTGPESARIGVDPKHDLGLALSDACGEALAESAGGVLPVATRDPLRVVSGLGSRWGHRREGYAERMPLSRFAWITTVLVALITAVLLLLSDYTGYAALSVAVGASAAINLL
jgi:hypothetical protein